MASFNWSLGSTSTWLNVSNSNGTLTPGGGASSVSLALDPAANLLPAGVYTASVWFTNLGSGLAQLRQFTLQAGQDLAQDGGFEAGDFCYWTLEGPASVYGANFVDNGTSTSYSPFTGNYFAALGQVSTLAYLSQPQPTLAGQLYLLSFWLENPSGATPNQFVVRWNTNSTSTNVIFNQVNMGAFGWSKMQFVVNASASVTTLQFGFRNDNDSFALDNVSVLPVPAPAFQEPAQFNGSIQLAWTALSGLQYQVQYKTNLAQSNWINLGGVLTAATNPMTLSDNIGPDPQRFYRVVLLP
jgi:hypothetical protein